MRNRIVVCLLLAMIAVGVRLHAESAAGLRWTAPAGWKTEAARPMRAATYSIASGTGAAECVVNYFGPGQGGTVAANVERWKGQIVGADGKPASAKLSSRTIGGTKVTIVDATGAYTGMGGPMASNPKPVPGYRLLGAIAEGPMGNVFFKLTGPAKTIAAQEAAFERLLASIRRE